MDNDRDVVIATPAKGAGRLALPQGGYALAALGDPVARVVHAFFGQDAEFHPFAKLDDRDLEALANALKVWEPQHAAELLEKYAETMKRNGRHLRVPAVVVWLGEHVNDIRAVSDCMGVDPPEELSITRVLSRAGSQKLVFLATWQASGKQVVVKRLLGPSELQQVLAKRESQSHPLSMGHPNIIETHYLKNAKGEKFFVEERLPFVLRDQVQLGGLHEAANLLYDMAKALNYLHTDLDLVHADLKPDNIGKRGEHYILLDFGICRPASEFAKETAATGSLRTRAPEVFQRDAYPQPLKVDVWALGATVYNALVGRFPLFKPGDVVPRITHPEEREQFEQELLRRIEVEWDQLVDLGVVPEPMRKLLGRMLERDPSRRCTAADVLQDAESQLPAYLRNQSDEGRLAPLDEARQLLTYLPQNRSLHCMPLTEQQALRAKLLELRGLKGLTEEEKLRLNTLLERIP
jgi:serine/threonine protein kinase